MKTFYLFVILCILFGSGAVACLVILFHLPDNARAVFLLAWGFSLGFYGSGISGLLAYMNYGRKGCGC